MISRNDACWCGSGKKWKKCHYPQKPELTSNEYYKKNYGIILKSNEEIEGIRTACACARNILERLCEASKEGVTTNELDTLSMQLHQEANAKPAPLHYGSPPFPKSICTSLNEMICHGIPNDVPLKSGDIMNIDVSCILDGYYGDCSNMVMIGEVSEEKKNLVNVAKQCLMEAASILKPNIPIYAIGDVIENIARKANYSVVNQFVGHGVGLAFHESPQIPHHKNRIETPLCEGMTFTIEPMINIGRREAVISTQNKWEARTADHQPSAQWEHTFLIVRDGYEILT